MIHCNNLRFMFDKPGHYECFVPPIDLKPLKNGSLQYLIVFGLHASCLQFANPQITSADFKRIYKVVHSDVDKYDEFSTPDGDLSAADTPLIVSFDVIKMCIG